MKPTLNIGDVSINTMDGAEMVWVPEGEFLMGSTDSQIAKMLSETSSFKSEWFENEKPQHKVYLDGYWMYKYEVTVAQYKKFCSETGKQMPEAPSWGWIDSHPIVNVSWNDAVDYAKWAGGSLPTEAQREKAARGTDGRIYPWGNDWDTSKCNEYSKGPKKTQPVGSYVAGVSPYGCMDMAGNAWEWCQDWYKSYPGSGSVDYTESYRVLRGGGWYGYASIRCAYRYGVSPSDDFSFYGFRLVH